MKIFHYISHNIRRLGNVLMMFSLCSLLFGCQDNIPEEGPSDLDNPEGMAKVTLLIPDMDGGASKFGTRALNVSEEGYMTNLYVIAVKYADIDDAGNVTKTYDPETAPVYTYSLNPVGVNFQVGVNDYHSFNMLLYPGKYRFGVIANVDLYLSDRAKKISEFTRETDLKSIVLNYREDTPLMPRHLPMACLPENIKYSKDNGQTEISVKDEPNNLIVIDRNETRLILAHMSFLCSKVRYTIMFDKTPGTGISEAFGSSWIRFNVDDQKKPWATNIRKQTKLLRDYEGGDIYDPYDQIIKYTDADNRLQPSSWTISIDRFYFDFRDEFTEEQNELITGHTFEGLDYPKKYTSELIPWDGTTEDWIPRNRKIWQGVVYLPENLGNEADIDKTVLKFPYHTRINSQDDTPEVEADNPKEILLFGNPGEEKFDSTDADDEYTKDLAHGEFTGLERDYMYDVVAKVVNPDDLSPLTVQVYVSIIPWHETDQNISESLPGSRPTQDNLENNVNDWEWESYETQY